MNLLVQARDFGTEKHAGQLYGTRPYTDHLEDVERRVLEAGFTEPHVRAAAYLHDVLEDTSATMEELQAIDPRVATLVYALTNGPGRNRRERHLTTYPRIRQAGRQAVAIKLCDRLSNVECCFRSMDPKLFMYHKEHPEFWSALRPEPDLYANGPEVATLWKALNQRLGFSP